LPYPDAREVGAGRHLAMAGRHAGCAALSRVAGCRGPTRARDRSSPSCAAPAWVWPDFLARHSGGMETLPLTRVRPEAPQGRSAAPPPAPPPPEARPPPRGPEPPPPAPLARRTTAPGRRPRPRHDRHRPPNPSRPTAGGARFRKNLGILKNEPCRDLGRENR